MGLLEIVKMPAIKLGLLSFLSEGIGLVYKVGNPCNPQICIYARGKLQSNICKSPALHWREEDATAVLKTVTQFTPPDPQDLLTIMVSTGYHRNQDPGQSTLRPSPTFCKEQNLPPNTS
ncbi:hypothetical protein TURU_062308 [Turdus rufiventris]|nr:hypothetical protein TURU_062308 [Turdus rufiventris]